MNWIHNLIEYEQNGQSGKCPFCNSSDIEVIETDNIRRSISFKCLKCGKGDHFDGIIKKQK